MSKRATAILLVAVAVLFAGGIAELLRMRFSRGDVFPVYSTYRADPLGTRAFYESLEIVPGARVQRWLRETGKLPRPLRGTLVFAGMERWQWEEAPPGDAARLDALVREGTRLVVTFTAGFEERELRRLRDSQRDSDDDPGTFDFPATPARMDAYKSKKSPAKKSDETGDEDGGENEANEANEAKEKKKKSPPKPVDLGKKWGAKIALRRINPDDDGKLPAALRAAGETAPRDWPATLDWLSEYYFDTAAGTTGTAADTTATAAAWRVLYTRETRPVLIERRLGAGSIVLASDSFFLSNEALQRARATPLLAWLAGTQGGPVVFDEWHLGMEEDTGVAALARRYGLGGAACMMALLAALWIWRRMALFVPPAPDSGQDETGYDPTAGLEALLRRSVPRPQLAGACVAEWRKTAGEPDAARVDKALATVGKNTPPAKIHNTLRQALRKR
jgi:hypothetical protein